MSSDQNPSTTGTTPSDTAPVSVLTGNRVCTHCGYNLIGQAVVREAVYGLLIVRCPECGAASAIVEYPSLGRWGQRWGAILGGLWALFLVVLLLPSVISVLGFSITFSEDAARGYQWELTRIFEEVQKHEEASAAPTPAPPTPPTSPQPGLPLITPELADAIGANDQTIIVNGTPTFLRPRQKDDFQRWWAAQDKMQVFRDAGGWSKAINRGAFLLWIPGGLITFAIGVIWSVVLIHKRRRWLPLVALLIFSFVAVIALIQINDLRDDVAMSAYRAARQIVKPLMLWLSAAAFTLTMTFGMLVGRPIVRGLLRLLVAPRVCGHFALLWTSEGLAPPASRR